MVGSPQHAEPGQAILFLHGGGYVLGSAKAYRGFVSQIVSRARIPALVIDYPLAPEATLPAAPNAAKAAWRWLVAQGFDRIAVVGDFRGRRSDAGDAGGADQGAPWSGADRRRGLLAVDGSGLHRRIDEGSDRRRSIDRLRIPSGLRTKVPRRRGLPRSPRLAAFWRSARPAATSHSGRYRRTPARRRQAICRPRDAGRRFSRTRDLGRDASRLPARRGASRKQPAALDSAAQFLRNAFDGR